MPLRKAFTRVCGLCLIALLMPPMLGCGLPEQCEEDIQLRGQVAGRSLVGLQVDGYATWSRTNPGMFALTSLPDDALIDLGARAGASKEEMQKLRKLWQPDLTLSLRLQEQSGSGTLAVRTYLLGSSPAKVGDSIQVYDATSLSSLSNRDLQLFNQLRNDSQSWFDANKPFAIVYYEEKKPGSRSYATQGQIRIEELWTTGLTRIVDFQNFDGSTTGTLLRVSLNATAEFSGGSAQIDGACINSSSKHDEES